MFAASEIEYLGHALTAQGVRLNSGKEEAVKCFPRPTTVKGVKSFQGLANFYRCHISDMARISRPLTLLTRKNVSFDWTEECEAAFCEIKQRLVSTLVLHSPDLTKPFNYGLMLAKRGLVQCLNKQLKKVAGIQLHMPVELPMMLNENMRQQS